MNLSDFNDVTPPQMNPQVLEERNRREEVGSWTLSSLQYHLFYTYIINTEL
jgi:hypothetical protein